MRNIEDQTLALAALFQSAALVHQMAVTGKLERKPTEAMLNSLFITDPPRTIDIYGEIGNLRLGLETLVFQMGDAPAGRNMGLSRYVIALLHLGKKVLKSRQLLANLVDGLHDAARQTEHFGLWHDNVFGRLADIYAGTISTLTPRIMVRGDGGHLAVPDNANRIRAILLAGIRAAVLWYHCKGSRLRLVFQRRAFVNEAKRQLMLLDEAAAAASHRAD